MLKSEANGRSLIYIRNNNGPNVEPCRTPQVSEQVFDLMLLIIAYCVLCDK